MLNFGVFSVLVAERNVHIARGLDEFAVGWNQLDSIYCFCNRHMADFVILITHHRPEMSFICQLHGFDAKTCGENSIQRRWRPASLQVP